MGPEAALSLMIGGRSKTSSTPIQITCPAHPYKEAIAIALITTFQVSSAQMHSSTS